MTAIPVDLAERLGWLLLHSLWQFALIGMLCHLVLRCVTQAGPSARYRVCLAGLVLIVVTSAVTAAWLPLPAGVETRSPLGESSVANILPSETETSAPEGRPFKSSTIERSDSPSLTSWSGWIPSIEHFVRPWLPAITLFWCAGLVVFSIRPLAGWVTVCQLRGSGLEAPSETMQTLFERTARRFSNAHAAAILQSARVVAPLTIGFLRPFVLIPVSLATSLSARELEAIIAHELAHIQRHDFLVNLLQTLVETVFFYHPAVWWLSRQIRAERENCCDDLAADILGSRLEYGRALIALEELRTAGLLLGPGANGGDLVSRIRRLTSDPAAVSPVLPGLQIGMVCVVAALISLAALPHESEVAAQAARQAPTGSAIAESGDSARKEDPEKKPDPLAGAPNGDAPFRVRLDDGAVIELAAIGMQNQNDDAIWWDPAGIDCEGPGKLSKGDWKTDLPRMEFQKDHEIREIAFKVWKPDGSAIEVRNSGPQLWGTTMHLMNSVLCRLQVPLTRDAADFTVRYSSGPWKVAAAAEANTKAEVNEVRFLPFDHENGRAICRVEHPFADYERRIAAFDKLGKWHEGVANSRQHSGKLLKDATEFRDVPEDELARILLEIRPVKIIEFRNVALHRGKATHPEVLIEGKPVPRSGKDAAETEKRDDSRTNP